MRAGRSFQLAMRLGDERSAPVVGVGMAHLDLGRYGPARASFVEARSRGVKNPADIDQVIGRIDARDGDAAAPWP